MQREDLFSNTLEVLQLKLIKCYYKIFIFTEQSDFQIPKTKNKNLKE